jgi:hypothetical protein
LGLARGIGIRYDREKGKGKDRSRFPEGMTERKARAEAEADPAAVRERAYGWGSRDFLLGAETWDVGGSSMLVPPVINI